MKGKKKLNILMFNRWVGYNQGGNETHIKELAEFLHKNGHHISLITTGTEALGKAKSYFKNVYPVSSSKGYYSLMNNRIFPTLQSLWFLLKSFLLISKLVLIDKKKIDVLSVHFSLEAFLARFVKFIYGIPYILILVGDTDFELIEGKYADVTVQISHFMADECKEFGYRPRVITKGVNRERFNTKIDREERKNFLTDLKKEKIVIAVCRLDPRKNLETLVKAAAITVRKHPEFKYLIVGGGTEEVKLQSLIKKLKLESQVFMTGSIPSTSDRLPRLYRAADVFAMPTLYEGFGYVYSEAMACGLPVISTDTSAVPEVVSDVGIIVPLRNPKALAESITKVLTDDAVKNKMIKAGAKKVNQWYWDVLIHDYEEAYYECASMKKNIFLRSGDFLKTLGSTIFLVKKTFGFVFSPELLRWGPTKKSN